MNKEIKDSYYIEPCYKHKYELMWNRGFTDIGERLFMKITSKDELTFTEFMVQFRVMLDNVREKVGFELLISFEECDIENNQYINKQFLSL